MLALDRETASHVAIALHRHRGTLERTGRPCPPRLADLERLAAEAAEAGQTGREAATDAGGDAPDMHDGRMDVRTFYSRAEVAAMSGKSKRTVRRLIADGVLAETPLGIPRAAIDRLADQKESNP